MTPFFRIVSERPIETLPHNWGSFLYLYTGGGLLFLFGFLAPIFFKDYKWSRPDDRRALKMVVFGFLFFLVLNLLWQLYGIRGA